MVLGIGCGSLLGGLDPKPYLSLSLALSISPSLHLSISPSLSLSLSLFGVVLSLTISAWPSFLPVYLSV